MNAVEIADAVTELFAHPFEAAEFPFQFLEAFGNRETTIKRLRSGNSNASDVPGGVLQKSNIHLAVCAPGEVGATLDALRASPKTATAKAKFILATDGEWLEAENLRNEEAIATRYEEFDENLSFILELGGITAIREIKEQELDVKAAKRLNKLYVELLRENPEWGTPARRPDLNHFMARLIFCFFAEDTQIFRGDGLFTQTVTQMSQGDGSNTAHVVARTFEVMNLDHDARKTADVPGWADGFPYVNGGLFSGSLEVPRFTRHARSLLLRAGELKWREINPDIFGSMIQAVADEEERGAVGMHYTSVPNIRKVLDPLFLDSLRAQLVRAGDHKASLLKLRERMARIRVFDPACGSGNFLVIAYKQMRQIEADINHLRGEWDRPSEIPLTNFRGIEIRDFAAEIARLALVIAEYQENVRHRGEPLALAEFLPLNNENWIWKGNALQLDWTTVFPSSGTGVKVRAENLFEDVLEQTEMDFANAGGETYLCGNPPYVGSQWRSLLQQQDMDAVFGGLSDSYRDLDYVACWFIKASDYLSREQGGFAFVATKSICQGIQVAMLWPHLFSRGLSIEFAYRPFKWGNLATGNAGVTCVIVGVGRNQSTKRLYEGDVVKEVRNIGPYLIEMPNTIVERSAKPINGLPAMDYGNKPSDGGHLILSIEEERNLLAAYPDAARFIKRYVGSQEFINGTRRACLWIESSAIEDALAIPPIRDRINQVRLTRLDSKGKQSNDGASTPHRFVYAPHVDGVALIVPSITSENREYLPVGFVNGDTVISNKAIAAYDSPTWLLSIVASRLHWVWVGTVCVRMRTDFSYSNTLGWNTFPVPTLTQNQKDELTRCAEDILLAREGCFPKTIADLYTSPSSEDGTDLMPENLRRAHQRNDETLERIYIGRRFKNDTERLEELFKRYTVMTSKEAKRSEAGKRVKARKA